MKNVLVTDLIRLNIAGCYLIYDEHYARIGKRFRLVSSEVESIKGKVARIKLEFKDEKEWKKLFKIKKVKK